MRNLRVVSNIFINQVPNNAWPGRNNTIFLDFCTEVESQDGWEDFTNDAKITIPKNIYYTDKNGRKVNLGNTNTNIGGFSANPPTFLKGDEVTIVAGYKYTSGDNDILSTAIIFEGFITQVNSKKPITITCEDNMYKLKQIPAINKVFKASDYTLESILTELLQGSGFTVNALTQTSIGDFRTQNETVCDVLSRLRNDYHFEAYFRGNELRCGSEVYIEAEARSQTFVFQQNIIDDDLVYNRKDDLVLSCLAYSINKTELQTLTKDGNTKTKRERLEVLVTYQKGVFTANKKAPGQKADFPANYTGERRTLYFWDVSDINELISDAEDELKKYYYDGFKGTFTTFGIPFVRQGDNAIIIDEILPERNGTYKIKSVKYKLSVDGGLRQTIELDYRIS